MTEQAARAAAAVGLQPDTRYRCGQCGNLTRFDVEVRQRTRRFWHVDLAGNGTIETEDDLEREVVSVSCLWCGSGDAIEVEPVPHPART